MADFFSIFHRPNLPEVRTLIMILSQGGALRAYPELLTAEPRRGSLMTQLLQYQIQTARTPRCEVGEDTLPVTAWRFAYTVFPTD